MSTLATQEEVRALARKQGNGGRLTANEQHTLDRSTSQAGQEGNLLRRLAGGSNERTD